jgi:integrase
MLMPQYQRKLKKGVRWYYKFDYDGTTYHSKAIHLTKQEAVKAERDKQKEIESQSENPNQIHDITLLDLINSRLDYLEAARTDKYYKQSKYYLKILLDYFGNINIQEITKKEMLSFLNGQSLKQKSNRRDNYRVNAMIKAYKALFFFGINNFELDIKNPCQGIKLFPVKKKIKYIPSDKEIQDVLDNCDPDQKLIVEFVRDTGCRISEALYLRRRDVFDGYVILYTRKSRSGNQTPREAEFETSKLTLPNLVDERVFHKWNDIPKFISAKANGKWSWHNLRHRYASILSKNNTPIFEIMCKLGHRNIETTQNYLQLLPSS